MAGKHGPNRLGSYVQTHEAIMGQLRRGGFVSSDDLTFVPLQGSILLQGTVNCQGGLYVRVLKRLKVLDNGGADALVQTVFYSYNVALEGVGNVFRYDSPHEDHRPEHHVHRYDVLDGDHDGRVEMIPDESQRPTLGEVIQEAADWYYEHIQRLQS